MSIAPFDHDQQRTDHDEPEPLPNGNRFPCFSCWCYGCGQPTTGPRDPRGDTRTDLVDPASHRWCFE